MRETKLCQHLLLLTEPMRKRFRRFLASPYFTPVSRHLPLFDLLDQHLLRYKLRRLSEQEAWDLYFPGMPFDQNKFRKECTALLQLLTEFLTHEAFAADSPQQALYLLQQLNALGEKHYFPGYAHTAQETLAAHPGQFDKVVDIGIERYKHDLSQSARNSTVKIGDLITAAELDHCARKMELMYIELNHLLVTGNGRQRDDEPFLQMVAHHLPQLTPLTRMFYHLFRCTRDQTAEEDFRAFRRLLQTTALAPQHHADMYAAALNYCARRLNAGLAEYQVESHGLHREMLELGLLDPEHEVLSPNFKNVIVIASRLGEFEWAKALMQRFHEALQHPANRNAFLYGSGIIAYYEGKLQQAEPCFHRVLDDFEDVFYGLDARGYLLRIFYQSGNLVGLDAMLDSYRMYIKRNHDLPAARKASHNEFIRLMRRLAHTNPHDKEAIARLQTEIQNSRKIPATQWLLQQVNALL